MVRYLFYTIGDLTYQSPLVESKSLWLQILQIEFLKITSELREEAAGYDAVHRERKIFVSNCLYRQNFI